MNTDEHRWKKGPGGLKWLREKRTLISVFICVHLWTLLLLSCGSKPTDPRTAVPADALVYLEAKDLGGVLKAITDNEAFRNAAKSVPDFSVLNGMKLSVAVTGFQTSEEALSNENAVLNFKPRFVAVVETNAWNYQALSFTENKLGEFINEIYDGEIELTTSDKHGGKYFIWTAKDGRKAYALVRGSLILFGNDESAIDNCVNVLNGGAESIAKNARVSALPSDSLASGYMSKDGVAQIANIAGISLAMGASEEGEVKSFIARVLPEIARSSITEVTWTSQPAGGPGKIQDKYSFYLTPDVAKVATEILVRDGEADSDFAKLIPPEYTSVTRYSLRNPQLAWRATVLLAQAKTDQLSGGLIAAFSSALFEAYAIDDPEMFLSGVGGTLQTIRFDSEGDDAALVARIKNVDTVRRSIAKEIDFSKPPKQVNEDRIWYSGDGEFMVATFRDWIVLGEKRSVEKCLDALHKSLASSISMELQGAPFASQGNDSEPEARVISVLADRKDNSAPLVQFYTIDTDVSRNGDSLERSTVSDFGLIGAIIARLGSDN